MRFIATFILLVQVASSALYCLDDTQKVYQHLTIDNYREAESLAKKIYKKDPSPENTKALVYALSKQGKSHEALELWERLPRSSEYDLELNNALEEICWGEIYQGASSSSIKTNYFSLVASIGTGHIRAVKLVERYLFSSNPNFRSLSIRMAGYLGDQSLRDALIERLHRETHPQVLSEIITTLGALKEKRLASELKYFLRSNAPIELQIAAASAYAELKPLMSPERLKKLIQSKRSGVRILATYLIRQNGDHDNLNNLLPLLDDPVYEVQVQAILTYALSGQKLSGELVSKLQALQAGSTPLVQITAAYALAREGDQASLDFLYKEVSSSHSFENQETALGALMHVGPPALSFLEQVQNMKEHPLFQLNAAYTLLLWDRKLTESEKIIEDFIVNTSYMVSQSSTCADGSFPLFRRDQLRHHPFIDNYPKLMDHLTRLKLISLLAVHSSDEALPALKAFLNKPLWGVPVQASLILIEEMPEEAVKLLKELLEDPDPQIRVQAALIIASATQDKSALPVLIEAYPLMNNEVKLYIIEALGSIGDKNSHPFLIEQLKSPLQSYRIAASGALIKSLNN